MYQFYTRPPMLDRDNFASWKQRIRLYCQGKENEVNILKSIDEGSFQMGTLRETLTEGTEGSLHLGPEQPRVCSDLTSKEKDSYNTDIWATNILFQGLPKYIYSLINYYTDAKDIWDNVKMLLEGLELTKKDRESQLVDRIEERGTMHGVQVQLVMEELRTELCMIIQNSEYFKDKVLLMQAQENRVALDEEQLLFIAADDCDTFDSDVDEVPTTQTLFMANLSSAYPVYDKASLSYNSDVLSEVHDHDHYQDAICEHHKVHEMHDDVRLNYVVDPHTDYMSDSNMIPYDQNNKEVHLDYLKHLKKSVATLYEIVDEAKVERPLDRSVASACLYIKHSQTHSYISDAWTDKFRARTKSVPAPPYVPPTNKELKILFQPMFDEYLEPLRVDRPVSPTPAVLVPVNSAGIAAESTLMDENLFAPVNNDHFINIFSPDPSFEASSFGDARKMSFFLGLQVSQNSGGIFINQSKLAPEILKKFRMESCDPVDTPKPPLVKLRTYMLREPIIKVVILTNLKETVIFLAIIRIIISDHQGLIIIKTEAIQIKTTKIRIKGNNHANTQGNNQRRSQFFQGASYVQNPPPAYQAPAYQAPGYQPRVQQAPIPQPQVVTTTEFTNYKKANDAILKNMQTNMTSLTISNLELKNMFGQFMKMNIASSSGSRTLPSNTITNPKEDMKGITTRSGIAYKGPMIPTISSPPKVVERKTEPVVAPVSASKPNPKPSIPYPSRISNQKLCEKANNQMEKFFQIFQDLNFNISFADALILMPKFASTIKSLLTNKEKLFKLDRSISRSVGVAKDVSVKVGKFHFLADFVVVDLDADPRVSRILRRSFLKTGQALIDVYEGELTIRVGNKAVTFNLDQTSRYSSNYVDISVNRIDVINVACEEYSQEVLGFSMSGNPTLSMELIVSTSSPTLTPFEDKGDILHLEEFLNDDLSSPPLPPQELKVVEPKNEKSYINEPPVVELKDLPPHLEYAFLKGNDKLPIIISKNLKDEEKTALIKVLKSHKQALAWQLSDIKGINLEFYTHKILMKNNFKPSVQHQSRVDPKIYEVIKKEVLKLLDAELIYPISDSPWEKSHFMVKEGIVLGHKIFKNEIEAYENSLIYNGKTKRIHDSKIKVYVFNIGDRVLLFNSRLKIFSGKLNTRWTGPFTVTQVFPYCIVELSQTDGPNFKANDHNLKHYFGGDIPPMVVLNLQTFPKDQ
uniref:Reverse transcriptase domain-containing protein n=1 Tax=Tanacetum cinerariifolium TaxID=118510 RepID=A0A6L2MAV2_TANCI|nr:reverse transcriptase domain-containing protein [Tanacetum cinerariifolium]